MSDKPTSDTDSITVAQKILSVIMVLSLIIPLAVGFAMLVILSINTLFHTGINYGLQECAAIYFLIATHALITALSKN